VKEMNLKELEDALEFEVSDLQCLESCAEQGFTIHDWVKCKSDMVDYLKLRCSKLRNTKSLNQEAK